MTRTPHVTRRTAAVAGLVCAVTLLAPARSDAQGCVPAKLAAPGMGVDTELAQGHWLIAVAFRSLHSYRDFQGSTALPDPSPSYVYASTHLNSFDVTATYAATPRVNLTIGVPIQIGTRRTYYEHDGVDLHTMSASGIGDARVIGTMWWADPRSRPRNNAALVAGIKLPTGRSGATDISFRGSSQVVRPVDPAIQPGDGGVGLLAGGQAYAQVADKTTLVVQGTYLFNPKETNGTQSPFADIPEFTGGDFGYTIDSVPDQYFFRAGVTQTVSTARRIAISAALRLDGVPSRDALGGSDGYRLPGYSLAIEPGFSFGSERQTFTISLPIAVHRHASKSVADDRTGNPIGGIAALADAVLHISVTRRF